MKLFTRYNRINLAATVVIFLLACASLLFILRYIFIEQVDDDLEIEQKEILSYINKYAHLPEVVRLHDLQTTYVKVDASFAHQQIFFQTIKQYDEHEREERPFRQITFTIEMDGQQWLVTVRKSLEGTDDLVGSIIAITICTILLILIASFLMNRFLLRSLWRPFYKTLDTIQRFKIGNDQMLHFERSTIEEFDLLNDTLERTVNKAHQDHAVLKEFTENASHELQTPLAVIRSKLDILIQDERLTEQQSNAASEAYQAIQKLSRMNQSLLLLTKIGNSQFADTTLINMKSLVEEKLSQFKDLWQSKKIIVTTNLDDAFITINGSLADVLLNNLLSNATKHNKETGVIDIDLKQGMFSITNTGSLQPLNEQFLFTRFYKDPAASENNGLGLSIVKQICEVSGCSIKYDFQDGQLHKFVVQW